MITTGGALAGVAAVELGMALTPGPNMIYLVSRSVSQGRSAGLVSLSGVALGFLIYLTAANLGLSAVFTLVPGLYLTVKLAGAAYLGWLAWKALKPGGAPLFAAREDLPRDSSRKLFTMGLMTCLLNPKIAILYVSLIPQFIDLDRGHVALQGFMLGGVVVFIGVAVNGLAVLAAGALSVFLARRPGWLRVQRYVMGTVLGALAVRLATDSSRPAAAT